MPRHSPAPSPPARPVVTDPYATAMKTAENIVSSAGATWRVRGKFIGPGIFIRWTLARAPSYAWKMWKEYNALSHDLGYGLVTLSERVRRERPATTYHSFAKHVTYLRQTGVIQVLSRTKMKGTPFPVVYYALTPGREKSPVFKNPLKAWALSRRKPRARGKRAGASDV